MLSWEQEGKVGVGSVEVWGHSFQGDQGLIFRQRPIPNLLPNELEQQRRSFKEQQPHSRHGGH